MCVCVGLLSVRAPSCLYLLLVCSLCLRMSALCVCVCLLCVCEHVYFPPLCSSAMFSMSARTLFASVVSALRLLCLLSLPVVHTFTRARVCLSPLTIYSRHLTMVKIHVVRLNQLWLLILF